MIKPFPRYYELLSKRGVRFTRKDIIRVLRYFNNDDIRDLQVLFNLAWVDPMFRSRDPLLAGLVRKGKGFAEEDKALVIEKQMEILRQVIPAYRRYSAAGQYELSVTPFYHPILPLLWDTEIARVGMPGVRLPKRRFSHPEDALRQIRMGIAYFEETFGFRPKGMWPSEGSVSEDVVRSMGAEGIRWAATDEEVLARSLGRPLRNHEGQLTDPAALYRPYEHAGVSLLFRDHKISDLIGFVYSGWEAGRAADDLVGRLLQARQSLPGDGTYVVPIILDGENAWEYYPNDGQDFLRALYGRLQNEGRIESVTVSEYLEKHSRRDALHPLHPGSWINANFAIWIGHEEDNTAWDYLSQTRDDLEEAQRAHPERSLDEAWRALFAAEGSDWNWWYGDEHTTETQEDFDELFRGYLKKVYLEIGKEIPQHLHIPVLLEDRMVVPATQIRGFIFPRIDGLVSSYFEWYQAAAIEVKRSGGSMHRSESIIASLYYGFNRDNLYVRADPSVPFDAMKDYLVLIINILHGTSAFKVVYDLQAPQVVPLYVKEGDGWRIIRQIEQVAAREIFEIELPFAVIEARENDAVQFSLDVVRNHEAAEASPQSPPRNNTIERCPWRGYISVTVPTADYEKLMWY
jgi:hypothetical protein